MDKEDVACEKCGNPSTRGDKKRLCDDCYFEGAKTMDELIKKLKLKNEYSAIDKHIIIKDPPKKIAEFCVKENINFWWSADRPIYLHIGNKKDF